MNYIQLQQPVIVQYLHTHIRTHMHTHTDTHTDIHRSQWRFGRGPPRPLCRIWFHLCTERHRQELKFTSITCNSIDIHHGSTEVSWYVNLENFSHFNPHPLWTVNNTCWYKSPCQTFHSGTTRYTTANCINGMKWLLSVCALGCKLYLDLPAHFVLPLLSNRAVNQEQPATTNTQWGLWRVSHSVL